MQQWEIKDLNGALKTNSEVRKIFRVNKNTPFTFADVEPWICFKLFHNRHRRFAFRKLSYLKPLYVLGWF